MNNLNATVRHPAELEALEARFALRLAARLSEQAEAGPADIAERLRFAREQALQRARAARRAEAAAPAVAAAPSGPALVLAGPRSEGGWWFKLASLLPLAVLIAGFVLIQDWHERAQIRAAAEVDADLLADDLPPNAYSDPGFVEFLKSAPHE